MWGKIVRGMGEGVCETPVRLPMSDGAMETVECMLVDIWCMLDWIIRLCLKTAEIHFPGISCSTSECTKWDTVVADGMKYARIRTHCKAKHGRPNMVKRGRMYSKQNWKWMLSRLWKNENIGPYVSCSWEPNLGIRGSSSTSQPPCHSLLLWSKLFLSAIWLYGLKIP